MQGQSAYPIWSHIAIHNLLFVWWFLFTSSLKSYRLNLLKNDWDGCEEWVMGNKLDEDQVDEKDAIL